MKILNTVIPLFTTLETRDYGMIYSKVISVFHKGFVLPKLRGFRKYKTLAKISSDLHFDVSLHRYTLVVLARLIILCPTISYK